MKNTDDKKEYLEFKSELQALLKKHKVYLYAEDCYGAELTDICAYKEKVFDGHVLNDEFLDEYKKAINND